MSRNHFQNILWNLHVSDPDETNPQKREANHDPLFLVRPMVDIMQRNFHTKYRPGKEFSLDESTCPFKDRVHFKCYNPKIKQKCSILNFLWSVNLTLATFVALKFIQMYLASHRVMHRNYRIYQKISCIVLGVLDSVQLLDMGHHVYYDNYYNSPNLIDLLHKRNTHACGTVRKN